MSKKDAEGDSLMKDRSEGDNHEFENRSAG